MKVLKFGTTAIANIEKVNIVIDILKKTPNSIVVFSAMAGTTDLLKEISDYLYKKNPEGASEIINQLEKEYFEIISNLYTQENIRKEATFFLNKTIQYIRTFTNDLFTLFEEKIILAQGEILSSGLFYFKLREVNINVKELSALDFMKIDKKSEPDINYIKNNISKLMLDEPADLYVTQGYICRNAYNEVDNFHFGGSDYTASLIGEAVQASEIQIWTDIDSMYGEESELASNTQTVHQINFDEAAELAYFGAKILHPMCILPAKLSNIPVRLSNIYNPNGQGTLISNTTEKGKIKAIASKDNIIVLNIKSSKMLFANGFLRKICEVFEKHDTSIDMLTTSEVGISITIDNEKFLTEITNDLKKHGTVLLEKHMTLISIIGDLNLENIDLKPRVLEVIKDIPIRMISYGGSHNNLSFIINQEHKKSVLRTINTKLFLN